MNVIVTRADYLKERKIVRGLRRRVIAHPRSKVLRKSYARHKALLADMKRALYPPLRLRALHEASQLVGIMEAGGNNQGVAVTRIIRANAGTGPEPWCGDFVAYCYRKAGSKRVTRSWASVALLRGVLGIRATSAPQAGDIVRFSFDHVGIFVKDNANGFITTIEGNTGASGAVSDSSTGGDGVYRKIRSKGLVHDYLRVSG